MATSEHMVVYQATNQVNGKRYIGVTGYFDKRRMAHAQYARKGSKLPFHCAIRKYGNDAFAFSVLADFGDDRPLSLLYEEEAIAKYKPEYNVASGGQGGQTGMKHTPEARAKMSAKLMGRKGPWEGKKRSPETIEKMRQAALANPTRYWLGKKRADDTAKKISDANRGRVQPPEEIEHRRAALVASHAKRRRAVTEIVSGQTFPSTHAAAAHYGIPIKALYSAIYGKQLVRRAFRFKYTETPE